VVRTDAAALTASTLVAPTSPEITSFGMTPELAHATLRAVQRGTLSPLRRSRPNLYARRPHHGPNLILYSL
jgi:hypothetical protein